MVLVLMDLLEMVKEMDAGYHIIPVNLTHAFQVYLVERLGRMITIVELVQKVCREMEYFAQVSKAKSSSFIQISNADQLKFSFYLTLNFKTILISIDINDCQKDTKSSYQNENCFPGVECKDRKAPRRGFDCAPCPKGYVGNGKICQKESELIKN